MVGESEEEKLSPLLVWCKDGRLELVVVSKRSIPGASEGGKHCMKSEDEASQHKEKTKRFQGLDKL